LLLLLLRGAGRADHERASAACDTAGATSVFMVLDVGVVGIESAALAQVYLFLDVFEACCTTCCLVIIIMIIDLFL